MFKHQTNAKPEWLESIGLFFGGAEVRKNQTMEILSLWYDKPSYMVVVALLLNKG